MAVIRGCRHVLLRDDGASWRCLEASGHTGLHRNGAFRLWYSGAEWSGFEVLTVADGVGRVHRLHDTIPFSDPEIG